MDSLMQLVSTVDSKVWMAVGCVLVFMCLVSLVKKAISLAVTLAIIALLAFGASYVNTNIIQANGISFSGGEIYVGENHFSPTEISDVNVKTSGNTADVSVELKSGEVITVTVPIEQIDKYKDMLNNFKKK